MHIHYDRAADALYIKLDDALVKDSEQVRSGVTIDYGENEQIVGIEILDAKKTVSEAQLRQMVFEMA